MAGHDQVLFHATLQLSAFDLENLTGEETKTRPKLLLDKECIRLLRERVEDPILGISDQTIASVLFLMIIAVCNAEIRKPLLTDINAVREK